MNSSLLGTAPAAMALLTASAACPTSGKWAMSVRV